MVDPHGGVAAPDTGGPGAGLWALEPTPGADWPNGVVNALAMRTSGWQPTPLQEFVLKINQRCNLACDYCYVYTMADQSWRGRPAVMPESVWRAALERIAEHAGTHGLTEVSIILHGGEPLLAGAALLAEIADAARAALPQGVVARLGLQTNGVLLTADRLTVLRRHGIKVAVSVDGGAADHDRHRRYANGRGSFEDVARGLRLLASSPFRSIFAGLLHTIDPAVDPVSSYRALLSFDPPAIDLLLPHTNWDSDVPAGVYGPWLVRYFDAYYGERVKPTRIRLFDEILSLLLGGASQSEQVGLSPAAVAVVESDGSVEQTDHLKSAFAGAPATGRSVFTDSFDAVLDHPGFVARQIGTAALCSACRSCRLLRVCGGGHYAHRYRTGSGFLNPSVYCADMQTLIDHIVGRASEDIRAQSIAAGVPTVH